MFIQKTSDSMNYYSKLVLACQDEIIYTTETYLMIKNYHGKMLYLHYLIVDICLLLLLVIFTSCYCYYAKLWIMKEYASHINIK